MTQWLNAINRVDVDNEGNMNKSKTWPPKSRFHYVCSEHFVNIANHPDYVPSLFPHRQQDEMPQGVLERHDRRESRKKLAFEDEPSSSTTDINAEMDTEIKLNPVDIPSKSSSLQLSDLVYPVFDNLSFSMNN